MWDAIDQLAANSITIVREAYKHCQPMATLWSMGKDSTVLLWLVRQAFFGRIPFPVLLLDTGNELDEVYAFRDELVKAWQIPYETVYCPPLAETDPSLPPKARAAARKTLGLKRAIAEAGYKGILLGIRRDEQAIRGKERYFSPRDAEGNWLFKQQPPEFWGYYNTHVPNGGHVRIHPLLSWTEIDIWRFIERTAIPVVPLYFAHNGLRYRSLGEI